MGARFCRIPIRNYCKLPNKYQKTENSGRTDFGTEFIGGFINCPVHLSILSLQGSDYRRPLEHLAFDLRDIWVHVSVGLSSSSINSISSSGGEQQDHFLPAPEWPTDNAAAGPPPPQTAGPWGVCLPAKVQGWAKCGSWKGTLQRCSPSRHVPGLLVLVGLWILTQRRCEA